MDWKSQYYYNPISPCLLKLIYNFNTITKQCKGVRIAKLILKMKKVEELTLPNLV